MKAVFLFEVDVKKYSITPKDIRNFVMAKMDSIDKSAMDKLANKDKEGNEQSLFIYPKPKPNSFEVLNYNNDFKTMALLEQAIMGIDGKGCNTNLAGNDIKINKIIWKEEEYQIPIKELSIYKTRTPIVISINPTEHKMAHAFDKNGKLSELLRKRIIDITKMQCKQFFNLDIKLDDLEIKVINMNKITVTPDKINRKDFYCQAVYCEFISNYKLPRFLGYQTGMGYGEILTKNFGE